MPNYYATLSSIFGFIYVFGLFSLFIKEKLFLSESFVSVIFGGCIRSFVCAYLDTMNAKELLYQLSRIVISLQVVAVGVIVPKSYIIKEKLSLFMLLVPLMICTFVTSTTVAYYLLKVDIRVALIIGACVTPTDPVLAAAILKGKFADRYIPVHLRNLLVIESGANDGLGYLLLQLPLLGYKLNLREFMIKTILLEVIVAIILGGLIGFVARKMLLFSKQHKLIDKDSFLVSIIALGLFVTGICSWLTFDDILACFVCGIIFSREESFLNEIRESQIMEIIDLLFNHVFFILFGALFEYSYIKARYILIALVIIIIRRLPFFFIFNFAIPQLLNLREVFFAGWFGPVGVGALFFADHALHEIKDDLKGYEVIFPFICITIACSIFTHGITVPILHVTLKRKKKMLKEVVTESNCLVENEEDWSQLDTIQWDDEQ